MTRKIRRIGNLGSVERAWVLTHIEDMFGPGIPVHIRVRERACLIKKGHLYGYHQKAQNNVIFFVRLTGFILAGGGGAQRKRLATPFGDRISNESWVGILHAINEKIKSIQYRYAMVDTNPNFSFGIGMETAFEDARISTSESNST